MQRQPTKGSCALRKALEKNDLDQNMLEKELGVAKGTVSRWLAGVRRPDLPTLQKLKERFRIRVEDWLEPVDEPQRRPRVIG